MNIINGLACRLAKVGSISTMVFGLSFPAFAGAILSDFTVANPNDPGDPTFQTVSGADNNSLSTALMTFYLPPSVGANLTIQGFRSSLVDGYTSNAPYPIVMTRRTVANELLPLGPIGPNHTDNRGINLCSVYVAATSTSPERCRSEQNSTTAVNGGGADYQDESVRFSIADNFNFAVQLFTFGDVGPAVVNSLSNDNARMYFGGAEFTASEQFIDFNIRTVSTVGDCVADLAKPLLSVEEDRTCTVNIYNVVRGLSTVADNATDDQVFAFLESDYFRFAAIGGQDDWYIRGAQWVVAGPAINILDVPEPASLTLLGAGLFGLGYFGKRRTRYANA